MALLRFVPELPRTAGSYHPIDVGALSLAALPVLGLYALACTTGVAALARFVKSPPIRMVLGVGAIAFTFLTPLCAHAMRHLFDLGPWDLLFTNPAAALGASEVDVPLWATLAAYVGLAALFAAIASKPRA